MKSGDSIRVWETVAEIRRRLNEPESTGERRSGGLSDWRRRREAASRQPAWTRNRPGMATFESANEMERTGMAAAQQQFWDFSDSGALREHMERNGLEQAEISLLLYVWQHGEMRDNRSAVRRSRSELATALGYSVQWLDICRANLRAFGLLAEVEPGPKKPKWYIVDWGAVRSMPNVRPDVDPFDFNIPTHTPTGIPSDIPTATKPTCKPTCKPTLQVTCKQTLQAATPHHSEGMNERMNEPINHSFEGLPELPLDVWLCDDRDLRATLKPLVGRTRVCRPGLADFAGTDRRDTRGPQPRNDESPGIRRAMPEKRRLAALAAAGARFEAIRTQSLRPTRMTRHD